MPAQLVPELRLCGGVGGAGPGPQAAGKPVTVVAAPPGELLRGLGEGPLKCNNLLLPFSGYSFKCFVSSSLKVGTYLKN